MKLSACALPSGERGDTAESRGIGRRRDPARVAASGASPPQRLGRQRGQEDQVWGRWGQCPAKLPCSCPAPRCAWRHDGGARPGHEPRATAATRHSKSEELRGQRVARGLSWRTAPAYTYRSTCPLWTAIPAGGLNARTPGGRRSQLMARATREFRRAAEISGPPPAATTHRLRNDRGGELEPQTGGPASVDTGAATIVA